MREAQTEFEKVLIGAMKEVADKSEDIIHTEPMKKFLKKKKKKDKIPFPPHILILDVLVQSMDKNLGLFEKRMKKVRPESFPTIETIFTNYLKTPKESRISGMVKLMRMDELQ